LRYYHILHLVFFTWNRYPAYEARYPSLYDVQCPWVWFLSIVNHVGGVMIIVLVLSAWVRSTHVYGGVKQKTMKCAFAASPLNRKHYWV